MASIKDEFINQIESHGFKVGIISIKHLEEIKSDMDATQKKYNDVNTYIGKYLNEFDYNPMENFPEAKSIIVIAVPQPMNRIYFTVGGKRRAVIMPPMYLLNSSIELEEKHKKISEVTSIIESILLYNNLKAKKINLPCKLIASRSGIGQYGKNNICYINNESSFYWMGVYISDIPCENDSWQKSNIMDACRDCDLCMANCPTGSITKDRFVIHASKCITLQNESEKDFPKWLNQKWNNSIIGCMRCQIICPVNRNSIKDLEDLAEFNEQETKMILSKTPLHKLPAITYRKLELINFIEYYELLARNLSVLIS
ncbi:4Fe-4S double cluster binding domain-containing protein [Clostridium akagii]|uniref:4Fe-4S double cluster binding domain-containing protein n=1 Tax=Clostridium akagii TaxID=91623 RepID=UPI00047C26EA|nr:4Fe-4S double cluster binding domain-containing protein [Clostridium akagii]